MLIAIAGSQGSGKSTVLTNLEECGYPVITRKSSRSILDEWGVTLGQVNNDRELTVRFQDKILCRKFEDEKKAFEDKDNVWFTERSFADFFTYALIAIGKDNEYDSWMDKYYARSQAAQLIYDQIFYLDGGLFDVQFDGVRGVNQHYSTMVDMVMKHYTIEMSECGVSVIESDSRQDRIDIIIKTIKEL